jgi:lipid-binding SYLF domain-containing protein
MAMLVTLSMAIVTARSAWADSAAEIDKNSRQALQLLIGNQDAAKMVAEKAKAVLVFPGIVKAGFLVGGQYGEGALMRMNGPTMGYYSSLAGSYGLQAGVQVYGYAMFFMNDNALKYLNKSDGWEIGVGPSIVIVDAGVGKSITSTTLTHDVYAFIFDQKGLMAGLGIQGSKITKIDR